MMYFFAPGSEFLFALLGLGIVIWLIGAGGKSLLGGSTCSPKETPVSTKHKASGDGKLVVRNAYYNEGIKCYGAEIVEAATGKHVFCCYGKTKGELEKELEEWLTYWSENHVS